MPLFPNASYKYTQINRQTVFQETAMASYARLKSGDIRMSQHRDS